MTEITHHQIQQMLAYSYIKVRDNCDAINKINVFPVPDQDTGDNLTKTMRGVYDAVSGQTFASMGDLRAAVLDGALTNASGNVGVIITAFLNGLFLQFPEKVTLSDITRGFREGALQSKQSIQDPKKGTILDVIEAAAVSLSRLSKEDDDFTGILPRVIDDAKRALDLTQSEMELYKQVTVVDAGGYGFVLMLEGLLEGLKHKKIDLQPETSGRAKETKRFIQILDNRYEVVSLVKNPSKHQREIVAELSRWGDSIDVVEANTRIKIHVHTDYPNEVVDVISSYGEVEQMKTTDMTEVAKNKRLLRDSIGLVIDDGAGLPSEMTDKNDIAVAYFQTSWDLIDQKKDSPKEVYRKMREFASKPASSWPRTSQPKQKSYYDAMRRQLERYEQAICIPFSSGLSGTYNSAIQARKMLSPQDQERVFVLDLKQGGGGQGILIFEALELIKKQYSSDQIIRRLETMAKQIRVCGIANDLIWLQKGGRINATEGMILRFLSRLWFQPVFRLKKGKLGFSKLRWGPKILSRIMYREFAAFDTGKPMRFAINHADNDEQVKALIGLLPPHVKVLYASVLPTVLGIHAGPDSLVIAFL